MDNAPARHETRAILFNGLKAEVPHGWRDDSTIMYSIPADSPDGRGTITFSWEAARGRDASAYLDVQLDKIGKALPGYTMLNLGDHGTAAEPMPFAEFLFNKSPVMVQMLMIRVLGDLLVGITGTALHQSYHDVKARFITIAKSVQLAK